MVSTGEGTFSFYRTCGRDEEQVRSAASQVKAKFSGSEGVSGVIESLRRDQVDKQAMLSRKKLELEMKREELADEQNPDVKDALGQYVSRLQAEINGMTRDLEESMSSLQKFRTLNSAVRQRAD
jgi:uncharacterized protein (DUF305 family)